MVLVVKAGVVQHRCSGEEASVGIVVEGAMGEVEAGVETEVGVGVEARRMEVALVGVEVAAVPRLAEVVVVASLKGTSARSTQTQS